MAKEWFVTHEGKQYGPVSFGDLRFEMERGELNPRLDMVWKNGMEDWIPAGEVPGLFLKNTEAAATVETSNHFTPYAPGETEDERERIKANWPGAGRGSYFFMVCVFPVLFAAGAGFATPFLAGKIDPSLLGVIPAAGLLVPAILSVVFTLKRFQNLGMTRWWFFGLLVPLLNFWVQYRLFACPPGHARNKKLDGLGWVLAILYWLLTIAAVAAIAAFAYFSAMQPDRLKEMMAGKNAQEFLELIEKSRQRGAELRTPETTE